MTQKEKIKQLEERVARLEESLKSVQDRQYEAIAKKFIPCKPQYYQPQYKCILCGSTSFPHYCFWSI